jgi:glycerate-2-kinase
MLARKMALEMYDAALQASLPKNFMHHSCQLRDNIFRVKDVEYDISVYKNIYLFGSGKASMSMAIEIEKILGSFIKKGLIVAAEKTDTLKYVDVVEGSHPIPSEKSISAGKRLFSVMQECQEDDLYIYLLSGGSSALIELPLEGVSLEDMQECTDIMLKNGLSIQEINSVRKHLSQIKGGKLAQANKATGIVLVLSDVLGDDLESIGSGPLYCDSSSFVDAKQILENKNLFSLLPTNVQAVLQKGVEGKIDETPKTVAKNVKHFILASNSIALASAQSCAENLGLQAKIADIPLEGDVVAMSQKIKDYILKSPEQCLIFGGECTVNVTGNGKGGRNQHLSGLMLQQICDNNLEVCFLSAATDGIDGNAPATGAVVDSMSCKKVDELGIDIAKYLQEYNSYELFKQSGDLIVTGLSGTNVIDIAIAIKTKGE